MDTDAAITEFNYLATQTANAEIKKWIQRQINERTIILAKQAAAKSKPQMMDLSKLGIKPPNKVTEDPKVPPAGKKLKITSFSWEETDTKLKFRLNNIKGFTDSEENKKLVFVDVQRCDISMVVHHNGCNHTLALENLVGDMVVNPVGKAAPVIKIKPSYVMVTLTKDYPREKWGFLTEDERDLAKKNAEKAAEKAQKTAASADPPMERLREQVKSMYGEADDIGRKALSDMLDKAKATKSLDPMELGHMMKDYMEQHDKRKAAGEFK